MGPVQELMNTILGATAVTTWGAKIAAKYEQKAEEAKQAAAASLAASLAEKAETEAAKGVLPK